MKVGDLVEWEWEAQWGHGNKPKLYRGIVVGQRYECDIRILKVVDQLGLIDVRADDVTVISESR